MMAMLSKQMAAVQSVYLLQHHYSRPVSKWLSGLITQLLQVTHCQWIYRCVDCSKGALAVSLGQHVVLSFNGYWEKRSEYSLAKP